MTDSEINVAIAEACGYVNCKVVTDCRFEIPREIARGEDSNGIWCDIPNYAADLNAMSAAELTINTTYAGQYYECLISVCNSRLFAFVATSRQRAEAFLRTIGKWKE